MADELELNIEQEEVAPVVEAKVTNPIKAGWLTIRHKTKKGGDIIVNAKQYGKLYKETDWEIIESKKK
jgi:hypothetical protein